MNEVHGVGGDVMRKRQACLAQINRAFAAIAGGTPLQPPLSTLAEQVVDTYQSREGEASWAFAQALRSLEHAFAWEPALESADPSPARFRDAARYIASKTLSAQRRGNWPEPLAGALRALSQLENVSDVKAVAGMLQRTPITGRVSTLLERTGDGWGLPVPDQEREPTPTVLLKFTLDGEPVSWPLCLRPARAYQLEAVASADYWPPEATSMSVELETDVPASVIERPTIAIKAGEESGHGYIVPKVEIGRTDPVSLTPRVTFVWPDGKKTPVRIVGQRSLRVSTFDPVVVGIGQPMVAQRIVELLAELDARVRDLPRQDRIDLVNLLEATARFQAVADERTDLRGIDERAFQAKLKQAFVQDRLIGPRIQEAPKLAGGTTDLMLGRIVNELKVSHEPIDMDDADRFVRQPVQYASASDCPVSVLTVLEDSPKSESQGLLGNYMRWAIPKVHGSSRPVTPSMVAVVIVHVGFPVPSAFSNRPPGDVQHLPNA